MFHDILHFQSLTCTDWDSTAFTGNVFCGFTASSVTGKDRSAKDGEWADFTGTSTVTYDPFGDTSAENAWADTYTTTSTNPIQKMTGF
mmetsp:Transcript_36229/g.58396  ORF Transcript_36229/g.58396 Transcript_36229/m.58396 type:complete len:88 (+) Transcript_36229:44-307(+)